MRQSTLLGSTINVEPVWDQWDYGPYGNKACNLCERHLDCRKEKLVFSDRVLGHPYCIGFQLSENIKQDLKRRGFWDRVRLKE